MFEHTFFFYISRVSGLPHPPWRVTREVDGLSYPRGGGPMMTPPHGGGEVKLSLLVILSVALHGSKVENVFPMCKSSVAFPPISPGRAGVKSSSADGKVR